MEKVTKFDLENAFKALNELNFEARKSLKENYRKAKAVAAEAKSPTDLLLEDYYDVNNKDELEAAKEERESEIAKAKLARIEKIVDLDAETPEDLEPSYVGKTIIQCPQCMTMFYKDPADVQVSEEDPDLCNVGEKCQHCGNDSGYTLVGKVATVEPEEAVNFEADEEQSEEDVDLTAVPEEEGAEEENAEDNGEGEENAEDNGEEEELPAVEETEEESGEDEEEKNEAFKPADFNTILQEAKEPEDELNGTDNAVVDCKVNKVIAHCEDEKPDCLGEKKPLDKPLTEDKDKVDDLAKKLKAHNEYIEFLQEQIKLEEDKLSKADNEFVKACLQRKIEELKKDLDDAIPDQVKAESAVDELPTPEEAAKKESLTEDAHAEAALDAFERELDDDLDEELDPGIISAGERCVDELEKINDKYEKLVAEDEAQEEVEEGLKEAIDDAPLTDPSELEAPAATDSEFGKMLRSPVFQAFGESLKEELDPSIVAAGERCVDKLEEINDKYEKLVAEEEAPVEESLLGEGLFKTDAKPLSNVYKRYFVRVSPANNANVNLKAKDENGEEIPDKEFNSFEDAAKEAIAVSKGERVRLLKKVASPYVAYVKCGLESETSFDACKTLGLLYKNGKITDKSEEKLNAIIVKASKNLSGKANDGEDDGERAKADVKPEAVKAEPVKADANGAEKSADEVSAAIDDFKAQLNDEGEKAEDPRIAKNGAEAVKAENVREGDLIVTDDGKVHEIKKDDPEIGKYKKSGKPAVRNATGKVKTTLAKLGLLENLDGVEEIDEESFGKCVEGELKDVYSNVDSFKCESCEIADGKLIVEGIIGFKSGKTRKTKYVFESACRQGDSLSLSGVNEGLCEENTIRIDAKFGSKLIAESFGYRCVVNDETREGHKELKD